MFATELTVLPLVAPRGFLASSGEQSAVGGAPACLRPRLKPRATAAKPRWGWSGCQASAHHRPLPGPPPPAHFPSLAGEGAIREQRFVVKRQLLRQKTVSRRVCDSAGCPRARSSCARVPACTRRSSSPAAEATGYRCQAPPGLPHQVAAAQPVSGSVSSGQSPAPPTVRPQPKRGEAGRGAKCSPRADLPLSLPIKKTCPGESVTRRVDRPRPHHAPVCPRARTHASARG